ncbi:helix-turn-helix domain-containing protein [Nonomuraea angiospora]
MPGHRQVFVGRWQELAVLKEAVGAVHGLGGVGKSTLAARYAVAQAGACNPVWWITADSSEAVRAGLAALMVALQPELTEALPLEALAERAIGWLAAHEGWLLVLDDVTDPADATQLLGRTLLRKSRRGRWSREATGAMLPGKKKTGRPRVIGPAELATLRRLVDDGVSATEAARTLKVGRSTAYAALVGR